MHKSASSVQAVSGERYSQEEKNSMGEYLLETDNTRSSNGMEGLIMSNNMLIQIRHVEALDVCLTKQEKND
jgi:hypothetical protein